jgi:hypothetical protein
MEARYDATTPHHSTDWGLPVERASVSTEPDVCA